VHSCAPSLLASTSSTDGPFRFGHDRLGVQLLAVLALGQDTRGQLLTQAQLEHVAVTGGMTLDVKKCSRLMEVAVGDRATGETWRAGDLEVYRPVAAFWCVTCQKIERKHTNIYRPISILASRFLLW
jgi:hypothetical protein